MNRIVRGCYQRMEYLNKKRLEECKYRKHNKEYQSPEYSKEGYSNNEN